MGRVWRRGVGVRWVDWLVVVIAAAALLRTGENISRMYRNSRVWSSIEAQVEQARWENTRLQGELSWVESPEFVEREARDRLGMGREGEVIILLPKKDGREADFQASGSGVTDGSGIDNWRRWWNLYVGSWW